MNWYDVIVIVFFVFVFVLHACQSLCVVRLRSTLLAMCCLSIFICRSCVRLYSYFFGVGRYFATISNTTGQTRVSVVFCRIFYHLHTKNELCHSFTFRCHNIFSSSIYFYLRRFSFSFCTLKHNIRTCEFEKPINVITFACSLVQNMIGVIANTELILQENYMNMNVTHVPNVFTKLTPQIEHSYLFFFIWCFYIFSKNHWLRSIDTINIF